MALVSGKRVVGLDIEPGYVAAVESRPGAVSVERAAGAPLPPGVVRDGEVVDVDTLADVLRKLFAEHKLSSGSGSASPTSGSSCARSTFRR